MVFLAIAAGLVFGAVLLIKHRKAQLKKAPKYSAKARPVTVAESKIGEYIEKRHYLAVVEPANRTQISARVTAPITQVSRDEGDKVKARQTLLRLDNKEVKQKLKEVLLRIKQARAELSAKRAKIKSLESSWQYWQAEAKRDRNLADSNAIPESQAEKTATRTDEVKGNLQAARKEVTAITCQISALKQQHNQLKTRLNYYNIDSPYSGVVSHRYVDPGALASPGKPLFEVEDHNTLKLSFDVPQTDLPEVKRGLRVIFKTGNRQRQVDIGLMYPSMNKAHMIRAEARLSDKTSENLSVGAYVPVDVVVDRHESVTLVPRTSVIESPDGGKYIFVMEQRRLHSRPVEVVGFTNNDAAVKGLRAGQMVVENTFLGWSRLNSGEKVQAVR